METLRKKSMRGGSGFCFPQFRTSVLKVYTFPVWSLVISPKISGHHLKMEDPDIQYCLVPEQSGRLEMSHMKSSNLGHIHSECTCSWKPCRKQRMPFINLHFRKEVLIETCSGWAQDLVEQSPVGKGVFFTKQAQDAQRLKLKDL